MIHHLAAPAEGWNGYTCPPQGSYEGVLLPGVEKGLQWPGTVLGRAWDLKAVSAAAPVVRLSLHPRFWLLSVPSHDQFLSSPGKLPYLYIGFIITASLRKLLSRKHCGKTWPGRWWCCSLSAQAGRQAQSS